MYIDLTLPITPDIAISSQSLSKNLLGHIGTHFDVMDKIFPLEYTCLDGVVFDVSHVVDRDIDIQDIDLHSIHDNMFVAFYTGFIQKVSYASDGYFSTHPQLSYRLIEELLSRKISIIGIDCSGIRRGKEHTPTDQRCADCGVFVVENLLNLDQVISHSCTFVAHTYPMNITNLTGLPCRVVAQIPPTKLSTTSEN